MKKRERQRKEKNMQSMQSLIAIYTIVIFLFLLHPCNTNQHTKNNEESI